MKAEIEIQKEFYRHLGKVFYAIAAADKMIREEEVETLRDLVNKEWLFLEGEKSKEEVDAMREIKQVFYDLAHEKRNAYECMAEFKAFKSSHEDLFDHDTKELIWKTAYYISTAVSSLNKSELILMTELATVLKLMEK